MQINFKTRTIIFFIIAILLLITSIPLSAYSIKYAKELNDYREENFDENYFYGINVIDADQVVVDEFNELHIVDEDIPFTLSYTIEETDIENEDYGESKRFKVEVLSEYFTFEIEDYQITSITRIRGVNVEKKFYNVTWTSSIEEVPETLTATSLENMDIYVSESESDEAFEEYLAESKLIKDQQNVFQEWLILSGSLTIIFTIAFISNYRMYRKSLKS